MTPEEEDGTVSDHDFGDINPRTGSATVFWRNNLPGGIGIAIVFHSITESDQFAAAMRAAAVDYDKAAQETRGARETPTRTPQRTRAACPAANAGRASVEDVVQHSIVTLSAIGAMKPDDHNGILWTRFNGERLIVIEGANNREQAVSLTRSGAS
jgi:hypothetical protein